MPTIAERVKSRIGGAAPVDIGSLLAAAATKYDLDPKLLHAVAQTESSFNPKAVSEAGATGVMQLMPGTAADMGVTDPTDAAQNIEGGARYLRQMMDQFGDQDLALAAYNTGPKNVTDYGGIPPAAQPYVKKVNSLMTGGTIAERVKSRVTDPSPAYNYRNLPAAQRQLLRQEVERRQEKAQGYPLAREMRKQMPATKPEGPLGRLAGRAWEFAGLPGWSDVKEFYRYWKGADSEQDQLKGYGTGLGEKLAGYGTGAVELAKGMAEMHANYLNSALDNFMESGKWSYVDPVRSASHAVEGVRNLVGAVPAIGPGTAEAAKMYGEGDWAGGTGALLGTYALAPLAGKLVSKTLLPKRLAPTAPAAVPKTGTLTEAFQREHARQVGAGATKIAETELMPPALGQPKDYVPGFVEEIGPLTSEQLNKPTVPGQPATLGATRLAIQAGTTTVPESGPMSRGVNARELRFRDVLSRSVDKILGAIDDATGWTKHTLGIRLGREVESSLLEEEALAARQLRQDMNLPADITRPEVMTQLGEQVKGLPQIRGAVKEQAAEAVKAGQAARGEGSFLSEIETPEQAGGFIRNIVTKLLSPLQYGEKGAIVGGGSERLLADAAYETLKSDIRNLPDDVMTPLRKTEVAIDALSPTDEANNAVMDAIRGPLRSVVEQFEARKGEAKRKGKPSLLEPNWLDLFEGYKALSRAETMQRNPTIKKHMESVREAIKGDLTDGLLEAGEKELSETFTTISNNYARVMEATRQSLVPGILRSNNPLVGRHIVDALINQRGNVVQKLNGLWTAMTTHWDPRVSEAAQAKQAMDGVKRITWNNLVETSSKRGPLGESVINWDDVVYKMQTNPKYKELLNYIAPGQQVPTGPGPFERLLGVAKAKAASAADTLHTAQLTDLLKSVKRAPREDLIHDLAHKWGLDNAQLMRQVLDSDPGLGDLDRQLRIAVLDSLYKSAVSDTNPRAVNLNKLYTKLVERSQELDALLPGTKNGLSAKDLRNYVEQRLSSGNKFESDMSYLKHVIDPADPEKTLVGIFESDSFLPWKRLVNRVGHDADFVRQLVRASFNHLIQSTTYDPVGGPKGLGGFGAEARGPGFAGAAPMTYTVGTAFYGTYIKGRPRLVELLKALPEHEATAILTEWDAIANSAKTHITTNAALRSKAFTTALASLSSYTQTAAGVATGVTTAQVGALVSVVTKLGMRLGMARYMATPAKSPFVEGSLATNFMKEAIKRTHEAVMYLPPVDQQRIWRLSKLMVPVEMRHYITQVERGLDEKGEPINPRAQRAPRKLPPMPKRPAVMSEARGSQ